MGSSNSSMWDTVGSECRYGRKTCCHVSTMQFTFLQFCHERTVLTWIPKSVLSWQNWRKVNCNEDGVIPTNDDSARCHSKHRVQRHTLFIGQWLQVRERHVQVTLVPSAMYLLFHTLCGAWQPSLNSWPHQFLQAWCSMTSTIVLKYVIWLLRSSHWSSRAFIDNDILLTIWEDHPGRTILLKKWWSL